MNRDKNIGVTMTLLLILLTKSSVVSGCTNVPHGQEKNLTITISGFTLPVPMAYGSLIARNQVPRLAISADAARTFVHNVVYFAMRDILKENAHQLDVLISIIYTQLTIYNTYEPLRCGRVLLNPAKSDTVTSNAMNGETCFIIGNTVSGVCPVTTQVCALAPSSGQTAPSPVPNKHLKITVTVKVGNLILANWSTEQWNALFSKLPEILSRYGGANFVNAKVTVNYST